MSVPGSGSRFTAWLSEGERKSLRRMASEKQCSENLIVRTALRHVLFGHDIPQWLRREKVSQ